MEFEAESIGRSECAASRKTCLTVGTFAAPVFGGFNFPRLAHKCLRKLAQIKHIQPFINSRGMTIIVDIHQANRGEPGFIGIRDQLQFERDWVQITSSLSNRSNVWLDLLNEPAMPMSVWRPIAQRTAQSIRRVNQASPIVFACPGADVSTHINSLRPLDGIANQVLTLHFWRGIHVCLHAFREADVWNYERNPAAWSVVTAWLRN